MKAGPVPWLLAYILDQLELSHWKLYGQSNLWAEIGLRFHTYV